MNRSSHRVCGFTVAELVITLAIVLLVIFLLITPAGQVTKGKAQRIKCVYNLMNLALAARIYSDDNAGALIARAFTNLTTITAADYFRVLSNELSTAQILVCLADTQVITATNFATLGNSNISYFANLLTQTNGLDPSLFLFGDRNLQTNGMAVPRGSTLRLYPDLDLGWTREIHDGQGNIATGDGSVQQFRSERLRVHLSQTVVTHQLLLIP